MAMQVIIERCAECGERDEGNWSDSTAKDMLSRELCFRCNYWFDRLQDADDPRAVRVDGVAYWIGDEDAPKTLRGYYGERFDITMVDGRHVTTHNLWCNGDIPEHFRSRLPDNARFEQVA